MTMGKRIKAAREKKGYSQSELAELLGYKSRSSINKIETDGRDIPRSSIVKFAKILDVTPSYLMGWDDEIDELNKAFAKGYDVLMGYLRERFDNPDEVNAAYELIIRLPMLNEAGINRMIERFDELVRFDEYKSATLLESESTSN